MGFLSSIDPTRVFRSPTRALNDAPGGQKEKILGRTLADIFSFGGAEIGFKQSDAINLQKAKDKAQADYDAQVATAQKSAADQAAADQKALQAYTASFVVPPNATVETQPVAKSNIVPIAGGIILALILLKGVL